MNEHQGGRTPSEVKEIMEIVLILGGVALLVLFAAGGVLALNWSSWGHWVVIVGGGLLALPVAWKAGTAVHDRGLHHVTISNQHKDHDHGRKLAEKALSMHYSVEFGYPDGRKMLLTSPLTIPGAPVTIKEINWGTGQEQAVIPAVVTQPSMDEMYNAVKYNNLEVAFGRSTKTGGIVTQGIVPGVHFKLVGSSGFGKSCLAAALLDIATRRNDPDHLRIALLDLENKTSRLFENLPHVLEMGNALRRVRLHAKDADEVARHLAILRKELDRRASGQIESPLLLIYVEEMLSLQYEVDERLKEQMLADLAILALRGRKYGMFLLACTQTDYSTKELREAQRQFRTRSGFAVDPSAARAAGFMNNELVKYNFANAKPGQFLLEKPAFSELVLAPLYDVEQKLQEMSNPNRVYTPNSWVNSESSPGYFPVVDSSNSFNNGNQDGKQWEPDRDTLAIVRGMALREKGVNEIATSAFPGMRNVDALAEVRRYIAFIANRAEV